VLVGKTYCFNFSLCPEGRINSQKDYLLLKLKVVLNMQYSVARFQVLMAVSMKIAVFWVVGPYSPVFRDACCLHHHPDDGR
jgi:hypothetical protein